MSQHQLFDPTTDAVQAVTDLSLVTDVIGFLTDGVLEVGESITFEYQIHTDAWVALKNNGETQQLTAATNNLATPVNAKLRINKSATTNAVSVLQVRWGK